MRRRAETQRDDLNLDGAIDFTSAEERRAAIKFFNAAFRAEESGLRQAHELSDEIAAKDPDLAELLRLYGNEEGWHRELLTGFLSRLGGAVQPMGRITGMLYRFYGRADRMETIVLTNLMFETIGSTTYRLALGRVSDPHVRQMLTILTRDEAFHVPLNVHFMKRALAVTPNVDLRRLRRIHQLLFVTLVALPLASRPKSGAFDRIGTLELARAYAEQLAKLFEDEPSLPFDPPRWLLALLGVGRNDLASVGSPAAVSVEAAERAANRENVHVTAM